MTGFGGAVSNPDAAPDPSPEGVVTRRSHTSFAETLGAIEAAIGARGLTVFARFDHATAAREAGLDMPETTVIVFGDPRAGTPLMVASPLIALELPLRVLVRVDPAGGALVSYLDGAFLAARYGVAESLAARLGAVARIVDAALEA